MLVIVWFLSAILAFSLVYYAHDITGRAMYSIFWFTLSIIPLVQWAVVVLMGILLILGVDRECH